MLEWPSRLWRIAATGFCFSVFGLGGLIMRCVVYPLLLLFVQGAQRREAVTKALIHYLFRCFVALMRWVGVLTVEVRNAHRLQRRGLLILANHPSLIDVVFLIAFVRHGDCIVKASLAQNPFTRGPVNAAGFITNNGGTQLLEDCLQSLKQGNNLIIFPEGTRTPLHGSVKLQRGAANVAVRGHIDITPVHISSSLPMLTKGTPWWQVPRRRPHFIIDVREDMAIAPFNAQAASESLAARQVTDHLAEHLFKEPSRAST